MSHSADPSEPISQHDDDDEIVELQFDEEAPSNGQRDDKSKQRRKPDAPKLDPVRIRKSRIRTHLIFLTLCVGVLAASVLMRAPDEEHVFLPGAEKPIPGSCMSREIMGIDCPGCGMTRAFISLGHLRFDRAWYFNPASFLMYAFLIFQVPWQAIQLYRVWNHREPLVTKGADHAMWIIAAAMVIQWLYHGFTEGFWHPPSV